MYVLSSQNWRSNWHSLDGHANYASSKGGVEMLRVNSISPGAIKTPINRSAWATRTPRRLLKLIPYSRVGEPEDVARCAVWLASDDSDYVTGATLLRRWRHDALPGVPHRRVNPRVGGRGLTPQAGFTGYT